MRGLEANFMAEAENYQGYTVERVGGGRTGGETKTSGGGRGSIWKEVKKRMIED